MKREFGFKTINILLLICVCLLLFVGNAFASEPIGYSVDRRPEYTVYPIECTSYKQVSTFSELETALSSSAAADRCIEVTANITFTSTITISDRQKKIVGLDESITLSGGGARRLFEITGTSTVVFRYITISDGYADNGGAISVASIAALELTKVKMVNNKATENGGAVYYNNGSTRPLAVNYSYFEGNSAASFGGAVYLENATAEMVNSRFSSNSAVGGAAIAAYSSDTSKSLTVDNCEFTSNSTNVTDEYGGAIYAWNYTPTINDSSFTGNVGGAVRVQGNGISTGELHLKNNKFDSNSSSLGGAVYAYLLEVYSEGNLFASNEATNGGALYLKCACSHLDRETIYGNSAMGDGGGIYNACTSGVDGTSGFGLLSLYNSTVGNNSAAGSGGGIYIDASGITNADQHSDAQNIRFIQNTITYNTAGGNGGGIFANSAAPANGYYWQANLVAGNTAGSSVSDCYTQDGAALYSLESGFSVMGSAANCSWTQGEGDKTGYSNVSDIVSTVKLHKETGPNLPYYLPVGDARDRATSAPIAYDVMQQARPFGRGADAGSYEVVYRDVFVTWDDNSGFSGIRPSSLTGFALSKDDSLYRSEPDVLVNTGNGWEYRFDDIEDGHTYTLTYPTPDDYTVSNYEDISYGWEITYSQSTMSLTVRKIWADASNNDGRRPESVCITLYDNGAATDYSHELSGSGDTWEYTFTDVPVSPSYTIIESGIHCQ